MSAKLRALQARKADEIKAAREFSEATEAKATAENRAWTAEETAQYDALFAKAAATDAQIDREQKLAAYEAGLPTPQPGSSTVAIPAAGQITVVDNATADPKRGFKSMGEFLRSVHGAALAHGRAVDPRLTISAAAPTTFGSEGSGADGGFLVPPEFSNEVFTLSLGEGALLPMTDKIDIGGNSMAFPRDETTPWGTDGIRAYWQAEASAATQVKPVLGQNVLRLKKLMALVPVTDELLSDTNALDAYLPKKIGASIQWKTNEAILSGAGNGTPLGALASGAVVTVAKDSGQATKTLTATNLANMIARLPEGSFPRAVWLTNNDVLPSLFTMTLGNYPIYLPMMNGANGAIQGSPYGSLLGRPVIVSQHANTFSSQGDVMLVDLSYYQTITKAEGIETATSMHLYFDADVMAFRTVFRLDGQPKITKSITPFKGSNNLSPFVQLAAR